MTTSPLAYFWGDDDFAIYRQVDLMAGQLAEEFGGPLDRWSPWSDPHPVAQSVALIGERLATPTMFGGGSFVVLTQLGALTKSRDYVDAIAEAIANLAPGNGVAIVDQHGIQVPRAKRKFPPRKRLADAVAAGGGIVRMIDPPKAGALVAWIEREAGSRGLKLEPGAARELASRIGGGITEDDVERRFQTRTASTALDKLALYRPGGEITIDTVRALVAEEVPGSIWALTDAVGERRSSQALATLDLVLESSPEPVILAMLHRRVRDMIEVKDRLASGEKPQQVVKATGLHPFVAEKMATQARAWTIEELTDALDALVELDAIVKGVPGTFGDPAQRRLAFTLWVMDHVPRRDRRSA
jgi:DNA polymerase III delta subunit